MEIDATVFNALISGIRRSLPFADGDQLGRLLEKHTNALFRMIHLATFGVSVQILALLFQILPSQLNALDRLYRAMYAKILDPRLTESRKLPLFISTLFKVRCRTCNNLFSSLGNERRSKSEQSRGVCQEIVSNFRSCRTASVLCVLAPHL